MDAKRWDRIQRLFHEALAMPPERRDDFVKEACADAPEITAEVLALLAEDRADDSLLDRHLADVADAVLEGSIRVPRRIGPYRLTRVLGEGGMGVVALAEREDLDNLVAIKFLRDAKLSPRRRELFLQEQRVLARLSHPCISRLYDAGTLADGTPYFVMEYVDGLPLTTYCERQDLALRFRLRLFRQVCEAVQYAHRQALVHRDLKPSNILAVGGPDSEPSIKLLDFGIAKRTEAERGSPTLSETAVGIMTPAYAAPEQLRGEGVGVATDVYALGVVLYELLSGALPFDLSGRTPFEAAEILTAQDPKKPSLRARRGSSPPAFSASMSRAAWSDLDVLCLTAMHKDPERRYATVEALLRDVDHYLAGRPLEARPDSLGYRLGKFVRRNRRAVAAGVAVVVGIVALVGFYTARLATARDAALAEAARTQRIQRFMLDLFEGGDDVVGPREGLLVTTLIDRGVRQARALEGEPAIQAELYQTLGEVYRRMTEFDRAQELLQFSLEQRRAVLGGDHADVADSLTALGLVASDKGELERAERLTREALRIVRERLSVKHPRYAETLAAVGDVLQRRGDYDQAVKHLDEAVTLQEHSGDTDGLMISLGSLANTHFFAGNYETSDALNRRLRVLVEEHLGANHPAYATVLINLAATRRWLGHVDEAERMYRDALVINEAYHGREHATVASNLSLLGGVLTDQERYDEAHAHIDEALVAREAVYGPNHYQVALTLNQLARLHLARKDLDAAEAAFVRELEIYRATVGEDHPWTATALSNVATIHFRRGREHLAEQVMRQSLDLFEAALKPDHLDVGIAHVKLGRLLAATGRPEEALGELSAGQEILAAQANPSSSWMQIACQELAEVHESLGDPARAAELRALVASPGSADD